MKTFLLLLLPVVCLSQKRLVPNENIDRSNGERYTVIYDNGLTLIAESLQTRRDLLVFDIELKNDSNHPVNFEPERFYIYASDTPFPDTENLHWEDDFIESPHPFRSFYAQDQRLVRRYYEKRIRRKENTKSLLAIIGAGLVIYDVAKDGRDFRSEPTRKRVNKSIARDVTVGTSLTAIDITNDILSADQIKSDEDMYYLGDEYLHPGYLKSGEASRGKVYLFQDRHYRYYRLMLPIEDLVYVFDFKYKD